MNLLEHKTSFHLVLPHENDDHISQPRMVDTATMTEDSSSDIFSVATSR